MNATFHFVLVARNLNKKKTEMWQNMKMFNSCEQYIPVKNFEQLNTQPPGASMTVDGKY